MAGARGRGGTRARAGRAGPALAAGRRAERPGDGRYRHLVGGLQLARARSERAARAA